MRMVRPLSAIALVIACLIHHVAYVENLKPLDGSNFSAALMRPRLPSWMRSRKETPRLRYFLAIETTSLRLASTSLSLDLLHPRAMPLASLISSAWVSRGTRYVDGGGYHRLAPSAIGRLAIHQGDLFLLERGVKLLDLRRREIPLLQEIGDLLCAEKALTSPPIQELVSPLRQHHGVLGRHLSPLLHPCAPTIIA